METMIAIITLVILCIGFGALGIFSRMGADTELLSEQFNADYFEQARMGFLHGMPQATLAPLVSNLIRNLFNRTV